MTAPTAGLVQVKVYELFRWGKHHAPPGHQLQILSSAWVVHRAKQDRAKPLSTASRQPAHRPVTQDAGAAPHDDKRPTRFVSRGLEYSLFLASEANVPNLGLDGLSGQIL